MGALFVVLGAAFVFANQVVAQDCASTITRFLGLRNCDDYVAEHLKLATQIKGHGLSAGPTSKAVEKMSKFREKVLLPTYRQSKITFDLLVEILDDLNMTGVDTGLCKETEKILGGDEGCSYLYSIFARDFLGQDGQAYYVMKRKRLQYLQDMKEKSKQHNQFWDESIRMSWELN